MKNLKLYALMVVLASCSMNYHLKKAAKKGYRVDKTTVTETIFRIDTVYDDTGTIASIDTTFSRVTTTLEVPVYIPMSRQERLALRDSMKHVERLYKDSLAFERKILDRAMKHLERFAKIEQRNINLTKRLNAKMGKKALRNSRIEQRGENRKIWLQIVQWGGGLLLLGIILLYTLPRLRKREPKIKETGFPGENGLPNS